MATDPIDAAWEIPLEIEMAEMIPAAARATGRALSRVGGRVMRTRAGRAAAREAEGLLSRQAARRAVGVTRNIGEDLAAEIGGVSRNLLRRYGRSYRIAQKGARALGTAASMYGLYRTGRKMLSGKRKLASRPGPAKKKKRKLIISRKTPGVAATFGTKFRKGKRPKVNTKMTKRHYDDYGIFTRDHALYFGMQTHGSQQRLCRIYGEALTRFLLSKVGIRPTSYDEICVADAAGTANDLIKTMALHMKSIDDTNGGDTLVFNSFNLVGQTFQQVAEGVGDFINSQLDLGQFPNKAYFYKTYGAEGDILHTIVEDLEYGKVTVTAKQVIRIQNLTPNDAGTTATDVTGTNPIQGKIYDFTTQPLLRSGLQETHSDLDTFQSHGDSTTGYYALPNSGSTASGGILGHPPNAGELFKNCAKVANVRIDAGHNKFKTTTFKFTGNLVDFVKRFNHNHNERNLGGGITWFGFEQAFRSGADQIKIAFNRELSMSAYYATPKKVPMLRHYEQTDLGDAL